MSDTAPVAPQKTPTKKAAPKKEAAPEKAAPSEGSPVGVSADDYGKPASVHRMVIAPD